MKKLKKQQLSLDQGLELSNSVYMCVYVCMCVCMNMHAGCECNVVIETCPQRDLESTFLRCDNVAFTTLPQPKHNVVTTLSQRDFVCWVTTGSSHSLYGRRGRTWLTDQSLPLYSGADPGGGVLGVRTPPPLLGDPKTSKRGKNVARVHANTTRFST